MMGRRDIFFWDVILIIKRTMQRLASSIYDKENDNGDERGVRQGQKTIGRV
jgi:hypothetical protein